MDLFRRTICLAAVPILTGIPLLASASNLLTAYDLARDNDPVLHAAAARRDTALEARPQARAALLPQIGASASAARTRDETLASNTSVFSQQTTYADSYSYGVSLTQPLFDQAAFLRLSQSNEQLALADAEFRASQQDLVVRVSERYFNLLAAEDSLRFAQAEKKAIGRQLERAQRRFEVGMAPVTDVQEAQARFDLATASEIDANRAIRSALEALRETTGQVITGPKPLAASLELLEPSPKDPQEWVETALLNNAELQAARLRTDIARKDIRRQEAARYPSLALQAEHGYSDNTESQFGTERQSSSIALNLEVPLFTGGSIASQVRASSGTHSQRVAELESARRRAELLTRNAYDGVMAGIARVRALEQAVKSTTTALEATDAGFQVGARTAVEVLDAQQELFRAQRDRSRARYDFLLDSLRLQQAAGQVDRADLERINGYLIADSAASSATN